MTSGVPSQFSIRKLFLEAQHDSLNPNPLELIDEVVAKVPEDQLREYLKDALRTGSVYTILAQVRGNALDKVTGKLPMFDTEDRPKQRSTAAPRIR